MYSDEDDPESSDFASDDEEDAREEAEALAFEQEMEQREAAEREEEDRQYATFLRDFMDDFEPSDQLTTEITAHSSQMYQIRIDTFPSQINTVMAVTNEEPDPIIVKIFKKGQDAPIKALKGKTEVLDVLEIMEEDDLGIYIVEYTNTSPYIQYFAFIIKQVVNAKDGTAVHLHEGHDHEHGKPKISKEEKRMYDTLTEANDEIKHFEVE